MAHIFVNIGYFLMLVALSVHEILWLRCILLGGQASLATYAVLTSNESVAFWNTLFFAINSIQIVRILRARRPVQIPAELQALYEQFDPLMRPRDFLDFWHMGTEHKVQDDVIICKGEEQKNLILICSGQVVVIRDGSKIAQLTRGKFVAEMSFLTGDLATADVYAQGAVQYMAWGQESLRQLQQTNPQLLIRIQGILGKDLITKVIASSSPV